MHTRYSRILLATLFLFGLGSCKQDYSLDTPLQDNLSPSVFVASENSVVFALNPITGEKKWERNLGAAVKGVPYLFKDKLYVVTVDGYLHRLDPDNGTELKKFNHNAGLFATPIGDGDNLYVCSGGGTVTCWHIGPDTVRWVFNTGGAIMSSPTLVDTTLVFGCNDGKVYAISKNGPWTRWSPFDPGTSTQFISSPVVAQQKIYIGAKDGNIYALNLSDGTMRWKFTTNGPIESSPIAYGGNVVIGSYDKNVYCIDSGSGLPRWVTPTTDRVISSPYANAQIIYVGSYDYNLYAIHIITGAIRWKAKTDGAVYSSPVVSDSTVYFGSTDKNFYAVDTLGGKLRWKYNINGAIEMSPTLYDSSRKATYSTPSGSSRY